jgi:WhiB family transcriptional regulator, redox-sensing transcriptional regulator
VTNPDHELELISIAWRLDPLRWAPTDLLAGLTSRDGACMALFDDEPPWQHEYLTDRELAGRMCTGCPVQDMCLELELRTAGENTVGVWGALPEQDRRALYPYWLQRGERAYDGDDPDGGPTP